MLSERKQKQLKLEEAANAPQDSEEVADLRLQQKTLQREQRKLKEEQLELKEQQKGFERICGCPKSFQKQQEQLKSRIKALKQPSNSISNSSIPSYASGSTQVDFKAVSDCPYMN